MRRCALRCDTLALAHLQDAVEDGVVHVLDVALARLDSATSDEVLPADDRREEDADWDRPRHTDGCQHVLVTNEQRRSLEYRFVTCADLCSF